MNKGWIYIWIGGLLEVCWISGMKNADSAVDWLLVGFAIAVSFVLILLACKTLPAGTVYAVFTGIGAAGAVTAEMIWWGEPVRLDKLALIALLLFGVIGLKLVTDNDKSKGENAKAGAKR
ncbi:multidrug efflux SMR transporter [Paenibacillus doosanensis]|uniref:Multidrug resistance protein YkkC n=1 Tax=Paenibacillus konkukensis TaxID=2020716 RepID=A0ABY4RZU1_9BACL|nr:MULTISPECIES: multidrug efflux SMR transporter [Paenibacillus]MCS7458524.1 multidrug efflux SMR transporter [Paenibacillus doosanensis]UQZ86953.1 Multidrug resistance protein YkkC [Paenibacillus konkukensis]